MKNLEEKCFQEVLNGCLEVNHFIINQNSKDKKTKKRVNKILQRLDEGLNMDEIKDYIEDIT